MMRDRHPRGVNQRALLAFEEEHGPYVVFGNFFIAEDLTRMSVNDGMIFSPPVHDARMCYRIREAYLRALAKDAEGRYQRAKERLKYEVAQTLAKPTAKQRKFIRSLKAAAEKRIADLEQFLAPACAEQEARQRRKNDKRIAQMEAVQAVDNL